MITGINNKILYAAAAVLMLVTLMAFFREGLAGMKTPFSASLWTLQYFVDLVIALGLFMIWMWSDCRSRGKNPILWIAATFVAGSLIPLAYLILRNRDTSSNAAVGHG